MILADALYCTSIAKLYRHSFIMPKTYFPLRVMVIHMVNHEVIPTNQQTVPQQLFLQRKYLLVPVAQVTVV